MQIKPFIQGQKEWKKGVVMERLDKWSYEVETMDGSSYTWNRTQLEQTNELASKVPESPPKWTAQESPIASSNSDENIDLTEKPHILSPVRRQLSTPLL